MMTNGIKLGVLTALAALAAGCMTDRPDITGTTYKCSGGTELRVDYLARGALVSVNGARGIPFKQTPSNAGAIYENGGMRLAREGNTVTWNTAQRSAAETCKVVNTIN
ncbi:MAG: MliC family protein [Erythrobacter sp.]|jgi:membrane-bound inhibitor of C-type lysozyme